MDHRKKDAHVRGGSLWPDSFNEAERRFLVKNMGKKKVDDFDGPAASVEFALEWAAGMDKGDLDHCKAAMKVPSAASEDSGNGGGNSPAPRKTKKTKKSKKE